VFTVRKLEREAQPPQRNQGSCAGHGGVEALPLQSLLCAILLYELVEISRSETADTRSAASSGTNNGTGTGCRGAGYNGRASLT
jgi:hypothetical protein